MKLLTLALVLYLTSASLFSQDSTKVKNGHEIYIDLQPVIALMGSSSVHVTSKSNDLFNNSLALHWTLQLAYKNRNEKGEAWRASSAFRVYPIVTNDYDTDSSYTSSEQQIFLTLGYEWQKGKGNWKYFFGADIVYYYSMEMYSSIPADFVNPTGYTNNYDTHELGLSGLIGGLFEISNHFILNSTFRLGIKKGKTKQKYSESINTSLNTETTKYSTRLNYFYEFNFMLGYKF